MPIVKVETNGASSAAPPATTPMTAPAGAAPALMIDGRSDAGASAPGAATVAVFRKERLSLGIGLLLAVAVLSGSWARVSSVDQPKEAIAAVGIAIIGLVLLALGAVGSTLTVKRHVQLRKAWLFSAWLGPDEEAVESAPLVSGTLVTSPGLTRYHRAGCPSVAGLPVRPVERRSLPSSLAACHLCDPGEIHLPPPKGDQE